MVSALNIYRDLWKAGNLSFLELAILAISAYRQSGSKGLYPNVIYMLYGCKDGNKVSEI